MPTGYPNGYKLPKSVHRTAARPATNRRLDPTKGRRWEDAPPTPPPVYEPLPTTSRLRQKRRAMVAAKGETQG